MRGIPVNGELIRMTRKSLGFTQELLAGKADCDVKTLRKAENSQHVDQSTVERIADALDVETFELINAAALNREKANIQVVLAWQEAFNRRDAAAVAEFFHEDGSVTVMTDVPIPGGGEFQGKEAVFQWAKTCFETMITEEITPEMMQLDATGEFVFLRSPRGARVTSLVTGKSAVASATHEFRITNGKIASHRVVTNTATFAKLNEEADDEPVEGE